MLSMIRLRNANRRPSRSLNGSSCVHNQSRNYMGLAHPFGTNGPAPPFS